jgi:chromate transporter
LSESVVLRLVLYLLPMSMLTVGGGLSITADLHRQMVDGFGWLTDAEFLDMFALTRMAPGPSTTITAMIGWKVAGLVGAIAASIAIYLPSSLLIYGLATVWRRSQGALWQRAMTAGLGPLGAGMILSAAVNLMLAAQGGWVAAVMALAAAAAIVRYQVNPLLMMMLTAGLFTTIFGWG